MCARLSDAWQLRINTRRPRVLRTPRRSHPWNLKLTPHILWSSGFSVGLIFTTILISDYSRSREKSHPWRFPLVNSSCLRLNDRDLSRKINSNFFENLASKTTNVAWIRSGNFERQGLRRSRNFPVIIVNWMETGISELFRKRRQSSVKLCSVLEYSGHKGS